MAIPTKTEFAQLPHWAAVAYIARCAQRLLPLYRDDAAEPAAQRLAATQAILLAEQRAAIGGKKTYDEDALRLDGQFFDQHDLAVLSASLSAAAGAADNTHSEVGDDAKVVLAATCLAHMAFSAAFPEETGEAAADLPGLAGNAVKWLEAAPTGTAEQAVSDFETLKEKVQAEKWTDLTPVPASAFGPMWPAGKPPEWPAAELSFKPRARIIRTIGDKLISGPEAAVIELIKNSHDADATFVRVTFVPPLYQGQGLIIVEDDGHGMSLEDIEQKWMEPATSDKRDRMHSPNQRPLLGSKGIGRFASARLGQYLDLQSSARVSGAIQSTRIPRLDWNVFEEVRYLEDVRFPVQSLKAAASTGTILRISGLRDVWTEGRVRRLYEELRKLVSPIGGPKKSSFNIFLDLSQCTLESAGFDGAAIMTNDRPDAAGGTPIADLPFLVRPFPVLDASDYTVDGSFDEAGTFEGTMTIGRGGLEPEKIRLEVPIHPEQGEEPCGLVLVKFNIFDREAEAVRNTARKAGFGTLGVREARKLLDGIAGVAIYREGFRLRPYGDGENDWLTLDSKRVQNPTIKIGRNQIAGVVAIDSEQDSHLVERSSREGLEENGSFRRLNALISTLLAEVVEPRRRQFRLSAGLENREEPGFEDIYRKIRMDWSKLLLAKLPAPDRAEAEALISKETDRLTALLKTVQDRQALLEAKVTMGSIVGEVMHQGNTPLSFIETESARLARWWPRIFDDTPDAKEDRAAVPSVLNGLNASSGKLRVLFNVLSPLSGARRGNPVLFDAGAVIRDTQFLFESRMQKSGIVFRLSAEGPSPMVYGYREDLATAVTNLIDNAVHWLEHHGITHPEITVTIVREAARCVITVSDNGRGIPPEFAEQAFDVGFTLKPNGTGLGLSIAKEAIQRSGGELQLLASPVGASFQITLPSEPIQAPETAADLQPPQAP